MPVKEYTDTPTHFQEFKKMVFLWIGKLFLLSEKQIVIYVTILTS